MYSDFISPSCPDAGLGDTASSQFPSAATSLDWEDFVVPVPAPFLFQSPLSAGRGLGAAPAFAGPEYIVFSLL